MGNINFVRMTAPYVVTCGLKVAVALLFNQYLPPELQHRDLRAFLTSDTLAQGLAQTMFWVGILGLTHAATMASAIAVNLRTLADMTTLNKPRPYTTNTDAAEDSGSEPEPTERLTKAGRRGYVATATTPSAGAASSGCARGVNILVEELLHGEPLHPGLYVISLGSTSALPAAIHRAMVTNSNTRDRLVAVNQLLLDARGRVKLKDSGFTLRDWDSAAAKLLSAMFSHAQLKLDNIMVMVANVTFTFLPLYVANTVGVWGVAPLIIVAHVLYLPLVASRVLAFSPVYCLEHDATADTLLDTDPIIRIFQIRWRNTLTFGENMLPCWPRSATAANSV